MVKIIRFLTVVFILNFLQSAGQDVIIQNGTVSTCGGSFYDTGKDTAGYSASQNFTMTICSDQPGLCVSLQFTHFDLENNFDFFYVYNGPSTSAPLLGTFTGSTSPGTVTATSGCLTIHFVSDYTVNKTGWAATINCAQCPVNGCPTCNGGSPPANDDCIGAQNLGALPIPSACPSGQGLPVTYNTTNLCSTPTLPYNGLQNCDPVGNMASPASDVWYKFTITAPILNVTINGMITPEVGLYSGSGCNNLVPRGCAIGGGGLLNTSFSGLAPGTYYLRVSGGTMTDQCNFALTLQNNLDCQGCVLQSSFTVNPPPQNGIYLAGQAVQFCLDITNFSPASANWLHAVIPHFGAAWDTSTLTFSPPVSCSGNGTWSWYNHAVTSAGNAGFSVGPGFFYETSAGNPLGVVDNDPGNNFGDNISGGCTLNFCFTIHAKPQATCVNGEDLNVFIDTYGDGETGAWTSVACLNDPVNDFYASIACCIPPLITVHNPLCNGQNGSAVGTGQGNSPWTFYWIDVLGDTIRQHNSATKDSIVNVAPGQYTLITVNSTGCESQTVFVIIEPQLLSASVIVNDTKCATNNGAITITPSGGTAPYGYSKNNGATFQQNNIFLNLASGNYNIVLKDANGCLWDTTITVAPSTIPAITNLNIQPVTCFNGTDGSITITATSGIAPYTYSINGGASPQASNQFNNLAAGIYQIVVTDANGCTTQTSAQVNQPAPVNLNILVTPANCGTNNGTITINVISGGTGSLLYSINAGQLYQASNAFSLLGPGVYTVVVQDANGCLAYDTAIVNNLNAPVMNSVTYSSLTCYHSSNGTITINASGGVGVLQYSINNGVTWVSSNSFSNLIANTYSVKVKDAAGCLASNIVALTEPPSINIRADKIDTQCGLATGSLNIRPENGVLPLRFSIDGGVTWQATPLFQNLAAGIYTVVVKDVNNCTQTRNYTIISSSSPTVSSMNITDATCFGAVTGSISINTAGGTPPIKYSIDGGLTFSNNNVFQNLVAGNYTILLQDLAGCNSTTPFVINQPAQLTLNIVSTNSTCGLANGSLTINASGGTGIYTFSNDGGASFGAVNSFSNLPAGNYKVVAMDANGCVEAATVNILGFPGPRITNTQATPQICDGINNGSLAFTAVSGTGILQYSIDSGATFIASSTFPNLFSGNYYIYVQDANNCRDSVIASIGIYHSPQVNSTASTNITCNGDGDGTITINATGGNGVLSYSITNGSIYTASSNFTSLASGTYYIVVNDTNNCRARDTVIVSQPAVLSLSGITTSEKCHRNDGTLSLHSTGGTQNYLFNVNGGGFVTDSNFTALDSGSYHIVMMDSHGCLDSINIVVPFSPAPSLNSINIVNEHCRDNNDGSITINASGGSGLLSYSIDNGFSFQATHIYNNLDSNSYSIIVSDTNNCQVDSVVMIMQPPPFAFSFQSVSANCNFSNGSLTVNASGGTGALTYSINQVNFTANPVFNNLASGNYTITVKDAAGCTENFVASVNNLNGPAIAAVNSTDLLCNGVNIGTISVNANGGSGNLLYSIDNGASFTSANNFDSLSAGIYSIVVSDTVGCLATNAVIISQPDPIVILTQTTNAACGQNDGTIILNVSGGTGNYIYSIDSVNYQLSSTFSNLYAGTYIVIVHDANNCAVQQPIAINNLLAPSISSISSTDLNCYHDNLGIISIVANGGSGVLSYSIDNGATFYSANLFDSLAAGTYHVVITDTNNCIDDTIIAITEPLEITGSLQVTSANCNQSNGVILVSAAGGTGTLLYSINGSSFGSASSFSNLLSGNYTISVKDTKGCTKDFTTAVNNLSAPAIASVNTTDLLCNGINIGTITINANGGSGNISYSIDNGLTTQTSNQYINLAAGNYNIVVSDTAGCSASTTVVINQPPAINIVPQVVNAACGQSNGSITLSAGGGTGALLYSIDSINYQAANNFTNLFASTYTIVVHDANNCVAQIPVTVNNLLAPVISSVTTQNLSCFHNQTGQIHIIAAGGTGSLSYSINNGTSYQPSANFLTLAAGTYYITVADQNNCITNYATLLNEPDSLKASPVFTNEICSNNNGNIVFNGAGGTSPYLFSIDSGTIYSTSVNYSLLNAGIYNLVIKDSHGCKTYQQTQLIDLAGPQISNAILANVNCYGGNDGSITVNAVGGNGTLIYTLGINPPQQNNIFSNLLPGNYIVFVTDSNSCTDTIHRVITQPALLASSHVEVNPKCFASVDGTINVNVTGGSPNYTIQWSNGISNDFSLTNLAAGIYYYTVSDQHLCSKTDSVLLSEPQAITITHSTTNGSCSGSANATASVSVSGGTTPYSYQWSPVASNTNYINNLAAGIYTVTVTDAHICVQNHSLTITNPTPVAANLQINNVGCYGGNNGSVIVNANGGYAPYSYLWYGTNLTDSIADSLVTGNYTVLITDNNGCTLEETISVTSPQPVTINATLQSPLCFGYNTGSLSLSVNGGVTPYSYLWSTASIQSSAQNLIAGNYTCTITDSNNCVKQVTYIITQPDPVIATIASDDTICIGQQASLSSGAIGGSGIYSFLWNTGDTTNYISASPSSSTNYIVVATDSNGCVSKADTGFVFVYPPLNASISAGDTICAGETVSLGVNPSGGNGGPYSYSWNPTLQTLQNINVQPAISTTYVATVNDNCTVLPASASTLVIVNPLPVVDFTVVPSEGCVPLQVSFINQSATPSGSLYQWNLGDGGNIVTDLNPNYIYTENGNYNVTLVVTTPENCKDSLTKPNAVKVYELPVAAFTPSPQTATILNAQINFVDNSYLASTWHWNFGDGAGMSHLQNPSYTFADTGIYTIQLIVASEHLCFDTTYAEVEITGAYTIYIPNAFTPNNDGKNDFFFAVGYGITQLEIQVYNRWGNLVFEGNSPSARWNGKNINTGDDCPQDVYVYKIRTHTFEGRIKSYEGKVTLVR